MPIVDEIIDGLLCEQCGCLIDGDYTGYPRKCVECECDENSHNIKTIKGAE